MDDIAFVDRSEPYDGLHNPSRGRRDDEVDLKSLVIAVHREVWEEFYSWEPEGCAQLIESLVREAPSNVEEEDYGELEDEEEEEVDQLFEEMDLEASEDQDVLLFIDLDNGSPIRSEIVSQGVKVKTFPSHRRYDACTPANRNIHWREGEPDDSKHLAFLPFADDPTFDNAGYANREDQFTRWDWIDDMIDPDLEVIEIEALRRLHFGEAYALSFEEIDAQDVLTPTRSDADSGLVWQTAQRDTLYWPGSSLSSLQDPLSGHGASPSEDDLIGRINKSLVHFCPSLNCLQPYCPTHTFPYTPLSPIKPALSNDRMRLSDGDPCGDSCFRVTDIDRFKDMFYWDQEEMDDLQSVLKVTPDLISCDLAVLCQKPCREVFVKRGEIITNDSIVDPENEHQQAFPEEELEFVDDIVDSWNKFAPKPPCDHEGPCGTDICSCFGANLHCERNCRCGLNCQRRWRGCKCKKGNCSELLKCRCRKVGRECDPDVCSPCGARDPEGRCKNVNIQRGLMSNVEVKTGMYGLGLFACKTIHHGDFIGEYVGDVLWQGYTDHVNELQEHRGLNYLFDLDEAFIIDAARTGNTTQYINHKSGKGASSEARILYVNGEHRIGIFASEVTVFLISLHRNLKARVAKRISRGQEILLDYGEKYWSKTGHSGN
ncbi:hypothetical protein JAAARDRAFT_39057 [Jaapia argillacea MUCL 33604]|uniref:SET domain-containing protein n=1 Tax=Jaapia argillacea MUCL 33604 TaxID=933084 RepID=A0A067PFQ4_9AGAM|nr:hypothetical protein JAAARDRAFT_39057 [Jaapia argillacea MUCL 33604]